MAEVLGMLKASTEEELIEVAQTLKLKDEDITKAKAKGWRGLLRLLQRYLSSDEVEEEEDEGKAVWLSVREVLVKRVNGEGPDEKPAQIQKDDQPDHDNNERTPPPKSEENPSPHLSIGSVSLRRDFRITGQIGEPQQKDRLSFSSLIRQIESGLRRGFSEEEVVEQVLRAIVPGLRLRSYLEGRAGLDLPTLRRILRAHYREKDATALFHELSNAAQERKETEHDFVLRAMDLRQKVLFACKEAGAGVSYGERQVQQMFIRAVSTGLQSDVIKQELKPFLVVDAQDEALLEALTSSVSHETERRQKLSSKGQKNSSINEVSIQKDPAVKEKTNKTNGQTGLPDWEQMQAAIRSIVQTEMKGHNCTPPNSNQPRKRGCHSCQEAGKGDSCSHCFRCGSSEHYARGCRKSGNGNRVSQRDMEHPVNTSPNTNL